MPRYIITPGPRISPMTFDQLAKSSGFGLHRLRLLPGYSVWVPDDNDPDLIKKLAAFEKQGAQVREEAVFELMRPVQRLKMMSASDQPRKSAFEMLDLDDVKLCGDGVTVGMLDGDVVDDDRIKPAIVRHRQVDNNAEGPPTLGEATGHNNGTEAHGTAVAGIIAGRDLDGPRVGVARKASLDIVSIDGVKILEHTLDHVLADLAETCRVINVSVATFTPTPQFTKAIRNLRQAKNTIIVGGIGNAGQGVAQWPGACDGVLSVGSVGTDGILDSESGSTLFGRQEMPRVPMFVAPGVEVESIEIGGGVRHDTGTSFAAPYVSGIIALMLEACPCATPDQIEAALISTAQDRRRYPGRCAHGVPSAKKAVAALRKAVKRCS